MHSTNRERRMPAPVRVEPRALVVVEPRRAAILRIRAGSTELLEVALPRDLTDEHCALVAQLADEAARVLVLAEPPVRERVERALAARVAGPRPSVPTGVQGWAAAAPGDARVGR